MKKLKLLDVLPYVNNKSQKVLVRYNFNKQFDMFETAGLFEKVEGKTVVLKVRGSYGTEIDKVFIDMSDQYVINIESCKDIWTDEDEVVIESATADNI